MAISASKESLIAVTIDVIEAFHLPKKSIKLSWYGSCLLTSEHLLAGCNETGLDLRNF
jgi:hypothetical protein